MILYHGSNTIIEKIDLSLCKPYKDFGKDLRNEYSKTSFRGNYKRYYLL